MSIPSEYRMFYAHQVLKARSICDYDCVYEAEVISRTSKTVTIEERGKRKTVKIHLGDNGEFCYPHGRYSMAARFYA